MYTSPRGAVTVGTPHSAAVVSLQSSLSVTTGSHAPFLSGSPAQQMSVAGEFSPERLVLSRLLVTSGCLLFVFSSLFQLEILYGTRRSEFSSVAILFPLPSLPPPPPSPPPDVAMNSFFFLVYKNAPFHAPSQSCCLRCFAVAVITGADHGGHAPTPPPPPALPVPSFILEYFPHPRPLPRGEIRTSSVLTTK